MATSFTVRQKGESKIGEIAARVGYRSETAFSKVFKRLMGVAPTVYRSASGQALQ